MTTWLRWIRPGVLVPLVIAYWIIAVLRIPASTDSTWWKALGWASLLPFIPLAFAGGYALVTAFLEGWRDPTPRRRD